MITISLVVGKDGNGLSVNTLPYFGKLLVAGREIELEDFRLIVNYVMCNSALREDDPRLELLEDMKSLVIKEIDGNKRLVGHHRPIPEHFSGWR